MNYAVKTPDGKSIFKVVLKADFPEGKTPADLDLWPVDDTIPEGKMQDFTTGEFRGWYLDKDTVRPILKDIPAPEPDPVPQSVSPWQMRRALNQLGLRAAVEAAVAGADQDTKDGWEYASEIRRDNPLIVGMAGALGMSDSDLDQLFTLAASFA